MKYNVIQFVYWFICLLVYCFIMPTPALASGEFQADYVVQYAISPTGTTIVTQTITLTNKQTNLYPQKYQILLDTTKIKNVIAYDNSQIVPTEITQIDGKTRIILSFNDKIVGIGRKLVFTLRFENGDIAMRNGSIWEITVPGITPDTDIASYDVSVAVPASFGPNAYMSPLPAQGGHWTKEQMIHGGITAAYGSAQHFDVDLSYYIDNPTITSVRRTIAIPPDTAYQTVVISSIDPVPQQVEEDADGNWIATYTLLPQQSLAISVKAHIALSLFPKDGYVDNVPDKKIYTTKDMYWESDSPQIMAIAKTATTPREIYQYVVNSLKYDYSRVAGSPIRKGALSALSAPENSICMEFTDLFIAIARAAGIPARQAIGYAYTSNSRLRPLSLVADVLHAWPEYYDASSGVWIAIDPTWANTTGGTNYFDKLDFNHIVFAIQGASSSSPYPAGFYRKNGKTTRDISVSFSEVGYTMPVARVATTIDFPTRITAGLQSHGTITIKNTTGVAQGKTTLVAQSAPIDIALTKNIDTLPPFGSVSYPFTLTVPSAVTRSTGKIVATVNGNVQESRFDIQPITSYFIIPIISFTLILVVVGWISTQHLWKRHKKH